MKISDTMTIGGGGDPFAETARATLWTGSAMAALVGLRSGDSHPRVAMSESSLAYGTGFAVADVSYARAGSGDASITFTGSLRANSQYVWHAGKQGAGTGMDSDKVDGLHASAFALVSHEHDAAAITSGFISNNRLGTGAGSGTTFLRDDHTWAIPDGGTAGPDGLINANKVFVWAVDALGVGGWYQLTGDNYEIGI